MYKSIKVSKKDEKELEKVVDVLKEIPLWIDEMVIKEDQDETHIKMKKALVVACMWITILRLKIEIKQNPMMVNGPFEEHG